MKPVPGKRPGTNSAEINGFQRTRRHGKTRRTLSRRGFMRPNVIGRNPRIVVRLPLGLRIGNVDFYNRSIQQMKRKTGGIARTGSERKPWPYDERGCAMSDLDPTHTDPDKYQVVFENDHVRVLEYRDMPGAKTKPHQHPNSVLLFLSNVQRRLTIGNDARDVTVEAGQAVCSPAQVHVGENIGTTDTHLIFVELKE